MTASAEHAKVLLEETDYNRSAALLLLRKRTITRCVDGAVAEALDRAFEVAIEIDHQCDQRDQHKKKDEQLAENRRLFREKYGELYP